MAIINPNLDKYIKEISDMSEATIMMARCEKCNASISFAFDYDSLVNKIILRILPHVCKEEVRCNSCALSPICKNEIVRAGVVCEETRKLVYDNNKK